MARLKTKHIAVSLPEQLHNEFYAMFPGTGERTAFLREVIATTVQLGRKAKLAQRVAKGLWEEKEERRNEN